MKRTISIEDNNIDELRRKYSGGLHWVVGDIHGEVMTLRALMRKIRFDPDRDCVYFVGDYNEGGNPRELLRYMAEFWQADWSAPGFHLIRGNHERELAPVYPLANMPDILALRLAVRGDAMRYFIVHAGMVSSTFRLICEDMDASPEQRYFAYRLDDACTAFDAPLRQITWSRRGLYSQRSRWKNWPDPFALYKARACIIHGHTPYCFFTAERGSFYGDDSLFWENQCVWFSEDLQSFDIDANIKGALWGDGIRRRLSCVCLECIEEIARRNNSFLSIDGILNAENFVFSEELSRTGTEPSSGDIDRMLVASLEMKVFRLDPDGEPYLSDR